MKKYEVNLLKLSKTIHGPVLLIELKWNQSAETAIRQIKDRKYIESVKNFSGNIFCVGIHYDKKDKSHTCIIEKIHK